MDIRALALLVAAAAAAPAARAQDADAERGRVLYETHCTACHYGRIHDGRVRPTVRDLSDLRDMVWQWAPHTRRQYTPDELEGIVQYLNGSHYRFGLAPERPRRGEVPAATAR